MLCLRPIAAVVGLLILGACANRTPDPRPLAGAAGSAGLTALEAPTCGARIFVAMGFNQNYPQQENMRVPAGDLYLNGELIDTVSKNPEITVLDVPVGRTTLSWVPSRFDEVARTRTQQKPLVLTMSDKQTAFVVLDFFDDTPAASGFFVTAPEVAIRTEVARSTVQAFTGKRVVFHRPLQQRCTNAPVMAEATPAAVAPPPVGTAPAPTPAPVTRAPEPSVANVAPRPEPKPEPKPESKPTPTVEPPKPVPQIAVVPPPAPAPKAEPTAPMPSLPAPKAEPVAPPPAPVQPPRAEPSPPQIASLPLPSAQPNASEAATTFVPAGPYYYYTVSAKEGAPAYETARAEGAPVTTFANATQLNVTAVSSDRRWLRVQTPDRKTVYVATAAVTMGARGR